MPSASSLALNSGWVNFPVELTGAISGLFVYWLGLVYMTFTEAHSEKWSVCYVNLSNTLENF